MVDSVWLWPLLPLAALAGCAVPVLLARYDTAALRVQPPVAPGPLPEAAARGRVWPALWDWCFEGTAPGSRPFWRPWAPPRMAQRFAVAVLGCAASGPALAEALSRQLDGSDQLLACSGAAARTGLRLRVKAQDLMWWRARQRRDAWDSGYLVDEPAALTALQAFRPRRASLLVAVGLSAEAVQQRIAVLAARQAGFAHPVRLLVVGTPAQPAWGAFTPIGG